MKKDADVGELWLKETATSVQTSRGTVWFDFTSVKLLAINRKSDNPSSSKLKKISVKVLATEDDLIKAPAFA
jgi:hypothetical protein